MVPTVPFNDILKDIRDRKKMEAELAKKNKEESCKRCGHNMMAIGKSTIPGICSICISLALLPDEEY